MRIKLICLALALSLCSLAVIRTSAFSDVYRCISTKDKKIALTFDDGPHYKYTDRILDILESYGVKATFFVIGVNAEKYPEKVKKIASHGHEIGNHTYSHPHLKSISDEELQREIEKASAIISKITDKTPTIFRPPEGFCGKNITSTAEKCGCSVILWSHDTRDWAHTPSADISKKILDGVKCGDIILFHDFITPDTPTPDALENVIPKLIERGYEFLTVSELISAE